MPNITLSIPEDLHKKMKDHKSIRWSEVVREAINRKITILDTVEKLVENSALTLNDADEISRIIKKDMTKRLK